MPICGPGISPRRRTPCRARITPAGAGTTCSRSAPSIRCRAPPPQARRPRVSTCMSTREGGQILVTSTDSGIGRIGAVRVPMLRRPEMEGFQRAEKISVRALAILPLPGVTVVVGGPHDPSGGRSGPACRTGAVQGLGGQLGRENELFSAEQNGDAVGVLYLTALGVQVDDERRGGGLSCSRS